MLLSLLSWRGAVAATLLGAVSLSAGCAPQRGCAILTADPYFWQHAPISEGVEACAIGGRDRPARVIPLFTGAPDRPATLTIHGINSSPESTRRLIERAVHRGGSVSTLAYDDRFRRLDANARDLSGAIQEWSRAHPHAPLRIEAHSMGARIALMAVAELPELDQPIELVLIAPPLGGLASANSARNAPGFIADLVGGVRPGIDMGTESEFQARLEEIHLSPRVRVRILLAEHDSIVDPTDSHFRRVVERIGASVETIAGSEHSDILDRLGPAR